MSVYHNNLKNGDMVTVISWGRFGDSTYYKSKLIKISKTRRFTLEDGSVFLSNGNGYGNNSKIVDITNEDVKKNYDLYLSNEQLRKKFIIIKNKMQELSNISLRQQLSTEENELINEVYGLIEGLNEKK